MQQKMWPSVKLVKHWLHRGSDAVCLAHSGPGVASFLSLSQLRTFLQISSCPQQAPARVFLCSVFHPLQPGLGEGAGRASLHTGVCSWAFGHSTGTWQEAGELVPCVPSPRLWLYLLLPSFLALPGC